jgi:hypothetical protein
VQLLRGGVAPVAAEEAAGQVPDAAAATSVLSKIVQYPDIRGAVPGTRVSRLTLINYTPHKLSLASLRSRADKPWHFAPPPAYELRHALWRRVRMRRGDGKPYACMCDMLRVRTVRCWSTCGCKALPITINIGFTSNTLVHELYLHTGTISLITSHTLKPSKRFCRNCLGRNPPFWTVKHPVRPHKTPHKTEPPWETLRALTRPDGGPGSYRDAPVAEEILRGDAVAEIVSHPPRLHVGLYPIVTSQYNSTALYSCFIRDFLSC